MYLKSLTIKGFKSFAQKTIFKFEPGITVIVGPNGSGKSNITDAVLWVLGEQSAKSLRGRAMEDVIFSGSASRPALGLAEVTLTLDNSDRTLPLDFTEVAITRRLYRSGESEYLINGTPSRLLDVQELMSDSGLGREMYSIISQGRLDEILSCRPEERRLLFEEAAGVLKHKKRKERALRKLRLMAEKVARAKDVLTEVRRQLAPLAKQAELAKKHQKLSAELKQTRINLAVHSLSRLNERWDKLNKQLQQAETDKEQQKEAVEQLKQEVTQLEAELEAKSYFSGDISEYRRRLASINERLNSGLLLLEEKGKNLISKLSELRQSIYQAEAKTKESTAKLEQALKEKKEADERLKAAYQCLSASRRQAEIAKKGRQQLTTEREQLEQEIEELKNEKANLIQTVSQYSLEIAATEDQFDFLASELRQKQKEWQQKQANLNVTKKEQQKLLAELSVLKEKEEQSWQELNNLADSKRLLQFNLENSVTRLRDLNASIAALEAVVKQKVVEIKKLIQELNLKDIAGTVSELLTIEPKYEKAVQSFLASKIAAIVLAQPKQAVNVFRIIKKKSAKEVHLFIPTTNNKKWPALPDTVLASTVINCSDAIRPVFNSVFDGVYICLSEQAFYNLLQKPEQLSSGAVCLSPSGDILSRQGFLKIVNSSSEQQGFLELKRELELLSKEKEEAQKNVVAAEKELSALEAKISSKQAANLELMKKRQGLEAKVNHLITTLSQQESELQQGKQKWESLQMQISNKKEQNRHKKEKLKLMEHQINQVELRLKEAQEQLNNKIKELSSCTSQETKQTSSLANLQVTIASLSERQMHLKTRILNLNEELKVAEQKLREQQKLAVVLEQLRQRLQPLHELYTALRLVAENWSQKLTDQAEAEQKEAQHLRESLKQKQAKLYELSNQLNQTQERLTQIETNRAQVQTEVTQITKHLTEEIGISLERALATAQEVVDEQTLRAKEKELKLELSKVGPVNQIAAAEYERLAQRESFLNSQIEDLMKSQKALEKLIKAVEKRIKTQFMTVFTEINNHFQNVFKQLFPGGEAQLFLDAVEGETEPGVFIEAQPQGKKLQSLLLLSGGERSLVGLALLFAFYYTRSSPFYILDEVEAALDDINLKRFLNLINILKPKTQFLIITHQRRTMNIADALYGVTMQADGVSQVFSQKLGALEANDQALTNVKREVAAKVKNEPQTAGVEA